MTFPYKLNLAPGGLDLIKGVLVHPERKKKTIDKAISFFIAPSLNKSLGMFTIVPMLFLLHPVIPLDYMAS